MTPKEAAQLLTLAEAGGCRKPDALAGDTARLAFEVFARVLTEAGCDMATATEALVAYLAEPNPGPYPKAWPDPGAILARTGGYRERAAQKAAAGTWFDRVMQARGSIGAETERPWPEVLFARLERAHGPIPDAVKEAIEGGIDGIGGWHRAGQLVVDRSIRERWTVGYNDGLAAVLVRPAALGVSVRRMLPGSA